MATDASIHELSQRRETTLIALTASLREGVRAMGAMDLQAVECCCQEQLRCCALLRELQETLRAAHCKEKIDAQVMRDFQIARISYSHVVQSSGEWARIWANMLQLANGGVEPSPGQRSLHC